MTGYLFDHDDGEEAGHEALEEVKDVCDGSDGVPAVGEQGRLKGGLEEWDTVWREERGRVGR